MYNPTKSEQIETLKNQLRYVQEKTNYFRIEYEAYLKLEENIKKALTKLNLKGN